MIDRSRDHLFVGIGVHGINRALPRSMALVISCVGLADHLSAAILLLLRRGHLRRCRICAKLKRALYRPVAVTDVWSPVQVEQAVLSKAILVLSNLIFVKNSCSWGAIYGATRNLFGLLWHLARTCSRFCMIVSCDECVLVVVERLVGMQVLFVHLLLNVCHIADLTHYFFAVHLRPEVLLVHNLRLAPCIALVLLLLLMEEASLLCTHMVFLLLS